MFKEFINLIRNLFSPTSSDAKIPVYSAGPYISGHDVSYQAPDGNAVGYRPVLLADNINNVFWLICECNEDFRDTPLDSYLVSQEYWLGWGILANIFQPDAVKTDGKWKIKWPDDPNYPTSREWRNRPIKPIREFISEKYVNEKLQIPALINMLNEYELKHPGTLT